jgi:hypothetical protein
MRAGAILGSRASVNLDRIVETTAFSDMRQEEATWR